LLYQPAPLPPPLSILNSITVTLSITTFQTINLSGSNRSRSLLPVLLLWLPNHHISPPFSNLSPPPENCDLATLIFSAISTSLTERAIFAIQCNFCATFAQFPVGWEGLTSNGQRDNCYHDGEGRKRHPLTPVCGRSVARGIGYCSTIPETIRSTRCMLFLHLRTAPVSPVSRYGNDSQQQGIGFVLANRYM